MRNALTCGFDPAPRLERAVRRRLREAIVTWRIPVHVTWGFVLGSLLACCSGSEPQPWLIVVLFSVALMHELPRAALLRYYGGRARVQVDALGGHTEFLAPTVKAPPALVFALIGSVTSLAVGLLQSTVARLLESDAMLQSGRLHLAWASLQLLPLQPFAMGRHVAACLRGRARHTHTLVSLALALVAVSALAKHSASPLVFVALSMWTYAACRSALQSCADSLDCRIGAEALLRRITELTLTGNPAEALKQARTLLASARSASLRARVNTALAWAAIGSGDRAAAEAAISQLPDEHLDAHLVAAFLAISQRRARAIALLESARAAGVRSSETVKLLSDLYYQQEQYDAVADLASTERALLSDADFTRIEKALEHAPPNGYEGKAKPLGRVAAHPSRVEESTTPRS